MNPFSTKTAVGAASIRPALRVIKSLGLLAASGALTVIMPVAALGSIVLRLPVLQHIGHYTTGGELALGAGALTLAALAPLCLGAAENHLEKLQQALRELRSRPSSSTLSLTHT